MYVILPLFLGSMYVILHLPKVHLLPVICLILQFTDVIRPHLTMYVCLVPYFLQSESSSVMLTLANTPLIGPKCEQMVICHVNTIKYAINWS